MIKKLLYVTAGSLFVLSSLFSQTVYGGGIGKIEDPEGKKTIIQKLSVVIEDPEQMKEVDILIKSNNIKDIKRFVNQYWKEFHDRVSVRKALDYLDELLSVNSFSIPFFAATALKDIMNERASTMNNLAERVEERAEQIEFLLKVGEYKGRVTHYLDEEQKFKKVIFANTKTLMMTKVIDRLVESVKKEERLWEYN